MKKLLRAILMLFLMGCSSNQTVRDHAPVPTSPGGGSGKIVYSSYVLSSSGKPILESMQIFTMNADGSGQTNLTNSSDRDDWSPAWSPDGTQIVFTSNPSGNEEIYLMNTDGSEPINLTNNRNLSEYNPVWSPDGREIAFDTCCSFHEQIYTMNADGSNPRKLTKFPEHGGTRNCGPQWSP